MKLLNHNILYAVTDRKNLNIPLESAVEQAIQGGVNIVQLREKYISDNEIIKIADKVKKICNQYNIPFIINDSVDIALEVGADGVHLGQKDENIQSARIRMGSSKIIGVSAKTPEQALAAEQSGADYLGVGAAFPTSTKLDASGIDFDVYRQIKNSVNIPVIAIGGITIDNILQLSGFGLDGVAVVSAIFSADNITAAAEMLSKKVQLL